MKFYTRPPERLFVYVSGNSGEIEEVCSSLTFIDKKAVKQYRRSVEAGESMEPPQPVTFFDLQEQRLLYGHLPMLLKELDNRRIKYDIDDLILKMQSSKNDVSVDNLLTIDYRDYQLGAISSALNDKNGIIKVATAGGKTIVAAGVIKSINKPSLFLVTQIPLLHQAVSSFQRFGISNIGVIGDGKKNIGVHTVADARWLSRLVKTDKDIRKWITGVDVLIVDECHRAAANSWLSVILSASRSEYRIGLSGTPFESRVEGESIRDIQITGLFGPIIYEIGARDLMDQGHIARPSIYMVPIDKPKVNRGAVRSKWRGNQGKQYNKIYEEGIVFHPTRNKTASQIIFTLVKKHGLQTLVLVNQIRHGQEIVEMLDAMGVKSVFVAGDKQVFIPNGKVFEDEIENFKSKTVERFANGEFEVMIGSPVFSEGYDLPGGMVEALVLMGGGKGLIPVLQRLGRALRPKPGLNEVVVIDFYDKQHFYLENHSRKRENEYGAEGYEVQGWGEFVSRFVSG